MEKLLKSMVPLAIELAKQRCRMEFFYIKSNSPLNGSELELVNNRNRRITERRPNMRAALVIAPGLRKIGDIRGGFLNGDKDTILICPVEVFLDSH